MKYVLVKIMSLGNALSTSFFLLVPCHLCHILEANPERLNFVHEFFPVNARKMIFASACEKKNKKMKTNRKKARKKRVSKAAKYIFILNIYITCASLC